MITVTATPQAIEPIAAKHMKKAVTRRFDGIDRVYRLYDHCDFEFSVTDRDGTLLIEARSFANHADATRWVEEDDRQRRLLHSAEVKA